MLISVDITPLEEHSLTMFEYCFNFYPCNMRSRNETLSLLAPPNRPFVDITKLGDKDFCKLCYTAELFLYGCCFVAHCREISILQFANIIYALNVAFVYIHSEKAVLIVAKSHGILCFYKLFLFI